MKLLTRIVLVQWYRIDALDIPIVGNVAVVGDNGAGKSAILDAVQTVLTGGNKNRMVLNRGSNEQSSRKLWEYVLGVLHDPKNLDIEETIKPRDKANCYLALNFYDQETQETTCVGMCIYASLEEADDRIEGWFIAPGLIGSKDLFLEKGEKIRVLPWARTKVRLEQACPHVRFHRAPGKFTDDLYAHLSEDPAVPNDPESVLKALRAAFRLEKISDPSSFIREYMLDRDDLQVQELRDQLETYRFFAEKTKSVKNRIETLSNLESFCTKVEEARIKQALSEWVLCSARLEAGEEKANPLREALGNLEEALEGMDGRKAELSNRQNSLVAEIAQKRTELDSLDVAVQRAGLKIKIGEAQELEARATHEINNILLLIQKLDEAKDAGTIDQLVWAIGKLAACLPGEDLMERQSWPKDPALVDACVSEVQDAVAVSLPTVEARNRKLCANLETIDERLRELTHSIHQLENNKAPLQENPRKLIRFLKNHGIEAVPLCDLVDVEQKQWRETIESILGNVREALIVGPDDAQKAVRLYRNEGRREFPGCHIVNTTQTDAWLDRQKENSLAACLSTDNPYARAFLNRRLGNIICVETEKDLLFHDRAATADGMFSTGGTVTELRPVPPILGRGSRQELLEEYRAEQNNLNNARDNADRDEKRLGKLKTLLNDFAARFPAGKPLPTHGLVKQREEAKSKLEDLQKQLKALAEDTREEKLKSAIAALEHESGQIADALKQLEVDQKGALRELVATQHQLETLEKQLDAMQLVLNAQRENPLLDAARAADMLDRLRDQYEGDFEEICNRAQKDIATAQKAAEDNERRASHGYADYHARHLAEEGHHEKIPESFEEYATLIRDTKTRLIDTTFADYEDQADRALQAAEEAFRSKFVSRLIDRLNSVRVLITQLNNVLERTSFHGDETYKFRSLSNPEFEHIIKFAEEVNRSGFGEIGGLFTPSADSDSPHKKALDDISTALQDPQEAARLQDYRNYLVFEVKILNKEGKVIGSLDHRIKKGSGGENQTPFYVAIGSSLAAAYRIRQTPAGKISGGMSLAVFDEAFSKLSFNTCQRCANFLGQINLQLLVAAPDDKGAIMAEAMDQLVWVSREGGVVDVSIFRIKHAMRALLQSDNPYASSIGEIPEANIA